MGPPKKARCVRSLRFWECGHTCAIAGAAVQLRDDIAEKDKRVQDLVLDVGAAKAYKAETEVITGELATQRKRYSEISTELAKCRYALENETLAKSSALSEKEGLWEVHERLVAKSARLQAQLKEAEDDCSRLQEQGAERSSLQEKLKHMLAQMNSRKLLFPRVKENELVAHACASCASSALSAREGDKSMPCSNEII